MRGLWLTAALLIVVLAAGWARAEAPTPIGVWLHANGRIKVQIAPCGDALCGEIVWFRWPNDAGGLPLVDLKNPDPALRSRPLLGLRVLEGLRPQGRGKWGGGMIYNPDDGIAYHAGMSIGDDGALRVRAYLLLRKRYPRPLSVGGRAALIQSLRFGDGLEASFAKEDCRVLWRAVRRALNGWM